MADIESLGRKLRAKVSLIKCKCGADGTHLEGITVRYECSLACHHCGVRFKIQLAIKTKGGDDGEDNCGTGSSSAASRVRTNTSTKELARSRAKVTKRVSKRSRPADSKASSKRRKKTGAARNKRKARKKPGGSTK